MKRATGSYPRLTVDTTASSAAGQAGGVLLTETIAATRLGRELSAALAPWRKPLAVHDPAKVITDLALTLALGGDCLADIALLRAEPGLFGRVASDATVSRTIDALAKDAPAALKAINTARAAARARAWSLANGCDYACSPCRRPWPAPGDGSCSTSPARRPGPTWSAKEPHDYAPWPPKRADRRDPSRQPRTTPATRNRRPPETTLGPLPDPDTKISPTRRLRRRHDRARPPHERSRLAQPGTPVARSLVISPLRGQPGQHP